VTVLVLASVAVAFAAQGRGGQGREKTAVCHKGHTLTVPAPALAAHQRHGDTAGDCPAEEGATPDDTEGTTPDDPESTAPDDPEGTTPDTPAEDQYGQEKATICHKGHTITVAEPALAAHQRHGDVQGACAAEDTAREDAVAGPAEGRDLYGDSAANTLRGTIRADFLQSGRGRDVVLGNIGNDYLVRLTKPRNG
jgi:hypothetical protein